jgi:hypothetical protein
MLAFHNPAIVVKFVTQIHIHEALHFILRFFVHFDIQPV